jgi:hypothetical protein
MWTPNILVTSNQSSLVIVVGIFGGDTRGHDQDDEQRDLAHSYHNLEMTNTIWCGHFQNLVASTPHLMQIEVWQS